MEKYLFPEFFLISFNYPSDFIFQTYFELADTFYFIILFAIPKSMSSISSFYRRCFTFVFLVLATRTFVLLRCSWCWHRGASVSQRFSWCWHLDQSIYLILDNTKFFVQRSRPDLRIQPHIKNHYKPIHLYRKKNEKLLSEKPAGSENQAS